MPLYTRLLFQYLICFSQKKLKYLHQYIIYGGIMNIKGLDVSEFQGEINWERVKNAGYQFAMIRAGYGFNTIDKQFQRMLLNATESVFRSEFTGSAMLSVLKRLFRKPTAVCAPFVIIELIILSAMILNRRPPLMLSEKVSLSLRLLQNNSFLLSAIVLKQGATMRCFTQTAVF